MSRLTRRLRAKTDYVVFISGGEWPVLMSALGVVLGAITILPSAVGIVLSIVALLLGTVTLVRDVRQLRGRWSAYTFSAIAAPFPTDELPPPAAYPDAAYLFVPNRGTALVSDTIDRALWDHEFAVELAEQDYALPPLLRATAPHVLPLRARGRLLFNGPVIGLRGDPLPAVGANRAPLRLQRAKFFDAQCSNELCTLRITQRDTGETVDLRRRALVDAAGRIRSLAASELADIVGISTIARTTDGQVVLVIQSDRNSASPLLLAPSGSGTLEPRDVITVGESATATLHGVVRAGMERELCEETGLRADEVTGTRVIGFARWMERGAKPEFFGLSSLSVSSAEVRARRPSSAERLYSAGVVLAEVDLGALGRELAAGTDFMAARSLPANIRDEGSLPLLLALRVAAIWTAAGEPDAISVQEAAG